MALTNAEGEECPWEVGMGAASSDFDRVWPRLAALSDWIDCQSNFSSLRWTTYVGFSMHGVRG